MIANSRLSASLYATDHARKEETTGTVTDREELENQKDGPTIGNEIGKDGAAMPRSFESMTQELKYSDIEGQEGRCFEFDGDRLWHCECETFQQSPGAIRRGLLRTCGYRHRPRHRGRVDRDLRC